MKFIKKLGLFFGAIVFLLAIIVVGLRTQSYFEVRSTPLAKEFYTLIDDRDTNTLDLRSIRKVDFDEITFWHPYEDICSLGIDGFEKNGDNCEMTSDDGECYLLFLKSNSLVGKVQIARGEIDFATSEVSWRVPRDKAVFKFLSNKKFPKVKLKAISDK